MRKILLIVFLLSLVSGNAFAKVEIWHCKDKNLKLYFKLDTNEPAVYWRVKGKWELQKDLITDEVHSFSYDKKEDAMMATSSNGMYAIYDFIIKTYSWYQRDGRFTDGYDCEVID